jgi:hypothetical protein
LDCRYDLTVGWRRGSQRGVRRSLRYNNHIPAAGVSMPRRPGVHAYAVSANWLVMTLVSALALAGCTTSGSRPLAFGQGGTTVAFQSIDGPPRDVFQKYIESLSREAQAQMIAVVSREEPAHYRIRGYLAAAVKRGRATFFWVWDVYDADERRALRIAGEEAGGRTGRNAWSAADEATLGRIAQTGMMRLASFVSGGAAPVQPAPSRSGPAVAEAEPMTVLARR